jgi:ATP-dependent protease ClpP protease subunit
MAAVKARVLEILIYEQIGKDWWDGSGVSAGTVADAIKAAGVFDSISLRINSPGGSCFDGVAIFNLLRSQGKPIDVFVDGYAASAASVIAMAGDTISMGTGSMLMIHNAMWGVYGDAAALRKAADDIENVSVTVGTIYVQRTKNDAAMVKALMDAETWMGPEEAIKQGFADKQITRSDDEVSQAKALIQQFNLKVFQHAPAELNKKEVPHASTNPECECTCGPCQEVGCEGCTNDPCEAAGCDCPNHQEMSPEFIPDLTTYYQRAALRERLV